MAQEVLFAFRCLREHTFSAFAPFGQTPDSRPCPECGHTATHVITTPSVHFKGDGFSRTSAQ